MSSSFAFFFVGRLLLAAAREMCYPCWDYLFIGRVGGRETWQIFTHFTHLVCQPISYIVLGGARIFCHKLYTSESFDTFVGICFAYCGGWKFSFDFKYFPFLPTENFLMRCKFAWQVFNFCSECVFRKPNRFPGAHSCTHSWILNKYN